MAYAAGLRRVSLSESQPKGEHEFLGSPPDTRGRKGSFQQLRGFRSPPVINRHCVIRFAVLLLVSLLVIRCGISLLAWDRVVSDDYDYSYRSLCANRTTRYTRHTVSSSAHPKLRKEHGYAGHDGKVNNFYSALGNASQSYHTPETFYQDFVDMACQFKIFVYPHSAKDPFANVFRSYTVPPTGNYASEHYFKMALLNSHMVTGDPTKADLFYLPFSIAMMRNDPRIGVAGIKHFVNDYVSNISEKYPYWNRSGGADHFYVNCHSIGKTATSKAIHVRTNAIQVVCSSSYHIKVFFPHKDATIPQVWPRTGFPKQAPSIDQRTTLAFFAGAGNSPVRALVANHWSNDTEIKVYSQRIATPYDEALLTSKYCLHVKGYEVNTARLADAMHYGCVPIIIADYHDLPFNDVLDWRRFALVVTSEDIPKLKDIIMAVSDAEYVEMQRNVMQVRQHFQWHERPRFFDAFYMLAFRNSCELPAGRTRGKAEDAVRLMSSSGSRLEVVEESLVTIDDMDRAVL